MNIKGKNYVANLIGRRFKITFQIHKRITQTVIKLMSRMREKLRTNAKCKDICIHTT